MNTPERQARDLIFRWLSVFAVLCGLGVVWKQVPQLPLRPPMHLRRAFAARDFAPANTLPPLVLLGRIFPEYVNSVQAEGRPLPKNEGKRNQAGDLLLRRLDCSMLNWSISQLELSTGQTFQTVRGVFVEGGDAFPGSCITEKSHIQIAVRDPACIVGVFLPRS